MPTETQTRMTLEEFYDLPDIEGVRQELLHGRLIETDIIHMGLAGFVHGAVQGNVFRILASYSEQTGAQCRIWPSKWFRKIKKPVNWMKKCTHTLTPGVHSVWLIYPKTRHVQMYRHSGEVQMAVAGQSFTEPGLLPGLSVVVNEIFANIPHY